MRYLGIIFLALGVSSFARAETGVECVSSNPNSHSKGFIIKPKIVHKGDSFLVLYPNPDNKINNSFTGEFPKNLGIYDPNGRFFIVLDEEEIGNISLSSKELAKCRTLKIDTAKLEGMTWKDQLTKELVFKKSGKYRLLLSDNLETEAEQDKDTHLPTCQASSPLALL